MKKVLMLLLGLFVLFGLTGCLDALGIDLEEEEELVLTDQDVENTAMGTIMAGYTSSMFLEQVGELGADAIEAEMTGVTIIESGTTITLTFSNAGLHFDEDGVVDLILDGSFSGDESTKTITYNNYKVTNPENTSENLTVNGTAVFNDVANTWTFAVSVSGSLLPEAVDVAAVMAFPSGDGDPSFTSATINGTDYLVEFNLAMQNM